jgi:hypothetical protein
MTGMYFTAVPTLTLITVGKRREQKLFPQTDTVRETVICTNRVWHHVSGIQSIIHHGIDHFC